MKKRSIEQKHIILILAGIWFVINLFFLTSYPFVHTDEPWLSGLTRSMMESRSPAATEDFFDLHPRHPHALKLLYHLLQVPFIVLFGYRVFAVRLLSLAAGTLTLLLFSRLLKNIFSEGNTALHFLAVCAVAADIQFIYGSHIARQEILLVCIETAILVILTEKAVAPGRRGTAAGLLVGAAAGIHPNAFILAWTAGLLLLFSILRKKKPMREGFLFLLGALLLSSLFVLLSFRFNASFLTDYLSYGKPFGVLEPLDIKWLKLPNFFQKVFFQVAGTYHTPPIMMQMILFPVFLGLDFMRNRKLFVLTGFVGYTVALVLIGKYSQPSIIMLLPYYYLGAYGALRNSGNNGRTRLSIILLAILLFANLGFSISDIAREKESFPSFLAKLQNSIPAESVLVGNLYGEYVTGREGDFYDLRNLALLGEREVEQYLRDRSVDYVMLTDELEFIYENRPVWNVLYGNIAHWYPRMKEILEEHGRLAAEFSSPGYGMRIAPYRYREEWGVQIYELDYSESIRE